MAKKNYYKMLGVSRTASPEEISAAKNRLAKKYHPDANMKNGIDTTRKMQQILEAYRILSDPKKRASYDRKVFGKPSAGADRNFDLFNLHNMEETAPVTGTPWYKNRNLPVSYLLKVYDDYSKKELSGFKRVKLQKELLHFQYSLKRLVSYT